jgi:hypothetical protein
LFYFLVVPIYFYIIVIPSEARDLHFTANCRSLASLGMTKLLRNSRNFTSTIFSATALRRRGLRP